MITLTPLDRSGIQWAQQMVVRYHYLHRPVDARTTVEGYGVHLPDLTNNVGAGCEREDHERRL